MMVASDVVEVLDRLDGAGIEASLDGGWGVDALLGEQTRPHDDLDLIVRVVDVPEIARSSPRMGSNSSMVRPTPTSCFETFVGARSMFTPFVSTTRGAAFTEWRTAMTGCIREGLRRERKRCGPPSEVPDAGRSDVVPFHRLPPERDTA